MGRADKDIHQKQQAVRYCAANGYLPFIEVAVVNVTEFTPEHKLLTDLDVLGVSVTETGSCKRILFDCKTIKTSPINRAFWAAGVSAYADVSEAFVILRRSAPEAHRLSAHSIGVHLYDDQQFASYAAASDPHYHEAALYLASIQRWLAYSEIRERWPKLRELLSYIDNDVPLTQNRQRSLRGLLHICNTSRGEFDPAKNEHMCLFANAVCASTLLLALIVGEFRNFWDTKSKKADFESLLRYYLWGGVDNYKLRQKMSEYTAKLRGQSNGTLEFFGWPELVELVRSLLDAPTLLPTALVPCKELAFRYLGDSDALADVALGRALGQNNRIRQYVFRVASYLVKAAGLPAELSQRLEGDVNELIERARSAE